MSTLTFLPVRDDDKDAGVHQTRRHWVSFAEDASRRRLPPRQPPHPRLLPVEVPDLFRLPPAPLHLASLARALHDGGEQQAVGEQDSTRR